MKTFRVEYTRHCKFEFHATDLIAAEKLARLTVGRFPDAVITGVLDTEKYPIPMADHPSLNLMK